MAVVDTTTVTPPPGVGPAALVAVAVAAAATTSANSSPAGEATAAGTASNPVTPPDGADGQQHFLVSSTELEAGLDLGEVIETTIMATENDEEMLERKEKGTEIDRLGGGSSDGNTGSTEAMT